MDVVHERCGGLDVHKDEVVSCARVVTDGCVQRTHGRFPTTTPCRSAGKCELVTAASGDSRKPAWRNEF